MWLELVLSVSEACERPRFQELSIAMGQKFSHEGNANTIEQRIETFVSLDLEAAT